MLQSKGFGPCEHNTRSLLRECCGNNVLATPGDGDLERFPLEFQVGGVGNYAHIAAHIETSSNIA